MGTNPKTRNKITPNFQPIPASLVQKNLGVKNRINYAMYICIHVCLLFFILVHSKILIAKKRFQVHVQLGTTVVKSFSIIHLSVVRPSACAHFQTILLNDARDEFITKESLHDKTKKWRVRPAKTQISLGIRPV